MDPAAALTRIRAYRRQNLLLFRAIADLVPLEERRGFVPRDVDGPDATMDLVESACRINPVVARALLFQIADNDQAVVNWTRDLLGV